jgi:hypothetical protein
MEVEVVRTPLCVLPIRLDHAAEEARVGVVSQDRLALQHEQHARREGVARVVSRRSELTAEARRRVHLEKIAAL